MMQHPGISGAMFQHNWLSSFEFPRVCHTYDNHCRASCLVSKKKAAYVMGSLFMGKQWLFLVLLHLL